MRSACPRSCAARWLKHGFSTPAPARSPTPKPCADRPPPTPIPAAAVEACFGKRGGIILAIVQYPNLVLTAVACEPHTAHFRLMATARLRHSWGLGARATLDGQGWSTVPYGATGRAQAKGRMHSRGGGSAPDQGQTRREIHPTVAQPPTHAPVLPSPVPTHLCRQHHRRQQHEELCIHVQELHLLTAVHARRRRNRLLHRGELRSSRRSRRCRCCAAACCCSRCPRPCAAADLQP